MQRLNLTSLPAPFRLPMRPRLKGEPGKGWAMIWESQRNEANIALKKDYVSVQQVLAGVNQRPLKTHVVLTGRNAPDEASSARIS
jgi:hypothetical protein